MGQQVYVHEVESFFRGLFVERFDLLLAVHPSKFRYGSFALIGRSHRPHAQPTRLPTYSCAQRTPLLGRTDRLHVVVTVAQKDLCNQAVAVMKSAIVTHVIEEYAQAEQLALASAFVSAFHSLVDSFVRVDDLSQLVWVVAIEHRFLFGPVRVMVTHRVFPNLPQRVHVHVGRHEEGARVQVFEWP